jgi:hypothetical protein
MAVVFGLRFQDTVDLTAVGTLLLATATFISLVFAGRALSASQREIEVALELGERSHRPVIVPVADHRRMELGPLGTTERMPRFNDGKTLVVPVENIGPGPALHVYGYATPLDTASTPPRAAGRAEMSPEVAGVANESFVALEIAVPGWSASESFELAVIYEDVAGRGWKTHSTWNGQLKRWTDVKIDEMPRRRYVQRCRDKPRVVS